MDRQRAWRRQFALRLCMMLSIASLHGDLSLEAPDQSPDPSSSPGLGTEFGLSVNQAAEAPTAALADSHIAGFTRSQE